MAALKKVDDGHNVVLLSFLLSASSSQKKIAVSFRAALDLLST
jgi:hypothetical protein